MALLPATRWWGWLPADVHLYVIGALDYARSIGALTGSIACVSHAAVSSHAEIPIETVTGPEVITGSTRMKAGTAQKLILNMLSTCTMIKLGKVYQNLMVDVRPSNEKLVERSLGILTECTGCSREKAEELLRASDYHVKTAILMALTHLDAAQATGRPESRRRTAGGCPERRNKLI